MALLLLIENGTNLNPTWVPCIPTRLLKSEEESESIKSLLPMEPEKLIEAGALGVHDWSDDRGLLMRRSRCVFFWGLVG